MRNVLILISLLFVSPLYGQNVPDEFKDVVWNRYVTNNFEILSIDDKQGEYLHQNVEKTKTWVYSHWGMKDMDFNHKCMVICVPTDDMFKKFFRKEDADPRFDESSSKWAIWVSLDPNTKADWHKTILPEKITHVCLHEFGNANSIKFDPWLVYGMSVLNSQQSSKMISISEFVSKDGSYVNGGISVKQIFNVTYDDIRSGSHEERQKFKAQSAALVLFLKKELTGSRLKFKDFIKTNGNHEKGLVLYGFNSVEDFERKYRSYLFNLVYDIKKGRTPRSYFTWYEKGEN